MCHTSTDTGHPPEEKAVFTGWMPTQPDNSVIAVHYTDLIIAAVQVLLTYEIQFDFVFIYYLPLFLVLVLELFVHF